MPWQFSWPIFRFLRGLFGDFLNRIVNKAPRLTSGEDIWFPRRSRNGFPQTTSCLGWLSPFRFSVKKWFLTIFHYWLWTCFRITSFPTEHASSSTVELGPRTLLILQEHWFHEVWGASGDDAKQDNCNLRGRQHRKIAIVSSGFLVEWHAQAGRDIETLAGRTPFATKEFCIVPKINHRMCAKAYFGTKKFEKKKWPHYVLLATQIRTLFCSM